MPREGHDHFVNCFRTFAIRFQSTCPARGTTSSAPPTPIRSVYFNPRAPRGARPPGQSQRSADICISIHVPREGHDDVYADVGHVLHISIHVPREGHDNSSSTPESSPRGARLGKVSIVQGRVGISIHVPREGHDNSSTIKFCRTINFNPRAPRGARQKGHRAYNVGQAFQSTCPARGTTVDDGGSASSGAGFQSTCPARGTTSG